MSTATAEPEATEAFVQQPEPSVLFVAKRSELRLVHTGRYPVVVPTTGQRLGETRGVVFAFRENELRVPLKGEMVIMDPGGAGEARMPAEDALKFLETHPRCGDPNEGFYRVDPKAPPLGQAEQQAIVNAATDGDIETLEAIIEQEREGWNRDQVIEVAQGAIDRINALLARLQADAEAKAAKGK